MKKDPISMPKQDYRDNVLSVDVLNRIPDMWPTLTRWEKQAIQQAAAGCVAGTLKEWPTLRLALVSIGVPDSKELRNASSSTVFQICSNIMAYIPNDH